MPPTRSQFVRYPEGNVLLRNFTRNFPIISHGKGVYLHDTNGKKYFDVSSGALVASVGHGNAEVVSDIADQLSKVSYISGTQFTSEAAESLATKLARLAKPLALDRSSFLCSGSEAVEAAIKFARQLWFERGEMEKNKLIARSPSYHGNTLYALSASGRPHYKKYFGPLLHDIITVSSPQEYRFPGKDYQKEGADYFAKELEVVIEREGAKNIMGFIVEPISGSSTGASLPPPGYFEKIQEVCQKYKILIIADEILCGSGRSGTFFASEQLGLKPDILVAGKGMSGGYVPLSAVMVKQEHVDEMAKGSGHFMHAQTFLNSPSMTAAGLAVLNYMERHNTVANAMKMGKILQSKLRTEIAPLPHVGFVSGMGLIAGIELVDDEKNKIPFARSRKIIEGFQNTAYEQGFTLWPNVGHVDGVNGDLFLVGPPLIINENEMDELVNLLKKTLQLFFQF